MAPCCSDDPAAWRPLNAAQRRARLLVGVTLLLLALALPWSPAGWIAPAVIAVWLGATHVPAAAIAYPGCPELGAAPSLLLRRWVKISCSPWQWLDARFRLTTQRARRRCSALDFPRFDRSTGLGKGRRRETPPAR